jgi:ABC-type glutathione transport system ATPase component
MSEIAATSAVVAAIGIVRSHGARGGVGRRRGSGVHAVRGVSLDVKAGEIHGLVGQSGAGKSTLARVLALLERPDAGEVRYGGERVDNLAAALLRPRRRTAQIVFQDPGTALDPLQRVRAIVEEPLIVHGLHEGAGRRSRIDELLAAVGLASDDEFLGRYPRELSGGERQRLAIARALACEQRALILDEPVSALDVSIRGQVLNVLVELRERLGLAMLLVAHDLALVGEVCDRVSVMLAGRIVEAGAAAAVLGSPLHPHTRFLVDSSLGAGSGHESEAAHRDADGAEAAACPSLRSCERAADDCRDEPELRQHHPGHWVACYFPEDR